MTKRRPARAVVLAIALVAATACSSNGAGSGTSKRSVVVFAASSLTDAFTAAGAAFTRRSGTKVTFSFAGSQTLTQQIQQGAPADALATADTATMQTVAGRLDGPSRPFARNRLVIVVAHGNPRHITGLADLADPKLAVVLADPSVPAGKYAAAALAAAHVTVHPRSLELDVRSVLTKVTLGEADAGIVYVTDADSTRSKVSSIAIPHSPVATYPIAALTAAGRGFVDFVTSAAGQAILHRYGFAAP